MFDPKAKARQPPEVQSAIDTVEQCVRQGEPLLAYNAVQEGLHIGAMRSTTAPPRPLDGSFDDHEHAIRRVSLLEDRLALLERTNVRLATQNIECWHGAAILLKMNKKIEE